ncbi:MAG: Ig-like domain-containing protein, partial [Myxococcales bacterium]|nr:Ig-like domain-containing protein [Myxococcales bacterium]
PLAAQDFVLVAYHPDFRYPGTAAASYADFQLFGAVVRKDIPFFSGSDDESVNDTPPSLRASHSPTRPAPFVPDGPGDTPTADERAAVTVVAEHARFVPRVEPPRVVAVQALSPDTPVEAGDVTLGEPAFVDGVNRREMTFTLTSRRPALVRLQLEAAVGGRVTRTVYPITIGGEPPPVENSTPAPEPDDRTGPLVTWTWPVQDARGVAPGDPIEVRFDEPVDAAIVADPTLLSLVPAGGGEPAALSATLSPDQRAVTLVSWDLVADTDYVLTLTSGVTDLRGNAFDQDPLTDADDSYSLRFRTAPAPTGTLPGLAMGGGAVVRGIYAYALDRGGPFDGAVVVYDLSDPTAPRPVKVVSVPGYPRDLALIGRYAYKPKRLADTEERVLLAVVGGPVGASFVGDNAWEALEARYQYLRIIDITDPPNATTLAATQLTLDATAVVPKVVWAPPFLTYLERGADLETVDVVSLQELLIGQNLTRDEWEIPALGHVAEPPGSTHGLDANGDGDFVDDGDELPVLPAMLGGLFTGLDFAGKVLATRVTDAKQPLVDFAFDPGLGQIGVILAGGWPLDALGLPDTSGPPRPPAYRTLMAGWATGPESLPPAEVTLAFPPETQMKRVMLIPSLPVRPAGGGPAEPADVALVTTLPDRLWLVDVTNVRAPRFIGAAGGMKLPEGHGNVQGASLRDDGLLALSSGSDVILLDPLRLTEPPAGPDAAHPALVGIVRGAGTGAHHQGASESGLNVAVELGKAAVVQTAPRVRFVAFPEAPAVVEPEALADLQPEQRRAAVAEVLAQETPVGALLPARAKAAGSALPSTLSPARPEVHYHVRVDAPGSAGRSIPIALESLGRSGEPLAGRGRGFAAVHTVSAATLSDLGGSGVCDAANRPLRAWRLSDEPGDPDYNVYLSDPFALLAERTTPDELAALRAPSGGPKRELLWSGAAVRASIDPAAAAVLRPFAGEVGPDKRLRVGVAAAVAAYPADYVLGPNPAPLGDGAATLPGTSGAVAAHSGEMNLEAADLALPSPRMPLTFARYLRGQDLADGPLGRGWESPWFQRLVPVPSGARVPLVVRADDDVTIAEARDVLLVDGEGHVIRFARAEGSAAPPEVASDPLIDELGWEGAAESWYLPERGVFDVLARFRTGQLARLTPDGTQYWYAADGRLEKIYDRYPDNRHLFLYDERGLLVRVEDESVAADRFVDLGYYRFPADPLFRGALDEPTGNPRLVGRVRRLRDHTGREVLYGYDDEARLTSALGPEITVAGPEGFTGRRRTEYVWAG